MSLDLEVVSSIRLEGDRLLSLCDEIEGARLVGDAGQAPASLILERMVRADWGYAASLDGPLHVEGEDLPGEPPASSTKNPNIDFHGEKRNNKTHRSTTDPEALLARKSSGTPARLCYERRS